MQTSLNKDTFEQYFFHGMDNKEQVVKWIIMKTAERLEGTYKELDTDTGKTRYEKDKEEMLELIVQLERFTTKHDKPEHDAPLHREYFYDDINVESEQIEEIFEKTAIEIKKRAAISFVKYRPVSGIFFNTYTYSEEIKGQFHKYSGREYLWKLRNDSDSKWGEEVYDILLYLQELERESKQEYYSLFLDTKYGRAIDRKTDKDKIELYDEREMTEIRNVYRKFLKRSTSFWCGY